MRVRRMQATFVLAVVAVALASRASFAAPVPRGSGDEDLKAAMMFGLTSSGVGKVIEQALTVASRSLVHTKIPDVHSSTHTSIGYVTYDITKINLDSIGLSGNSLTEEWLAPDTARVHIGKASMAGSFSWHVREKHSPHLTESGTGTISSSTISGTMDLKIALDPATHHPTLTASNAALDAGVINLKLKCKDQWIADLAVEAFKKDIHDNVSKVLNIVSANQMNQLAGMALAKLPRTVSLGDDLSELDVPIVAAPAHVDAGALMFPAHGEVYHAGQHAEAPFPVPALPVVASEDTGKDVVLVLTNYVVNSASWVYREAGFFHAVVDRHHHPSKIPWTDWTTTPFRDMIPELYKACPDCEIRGIVTTSTAPTVDFAVDTTNVEVPVSIECMYLDPKTKAWVSAFQLLLDLHVTAVWSVQDDAKLRAVATYKSLKVTLGESSVGRFDVSSLADLADIVIQWNVLPAVNDELRKGMDVPMPPMTKLTTDTRVTLHEDAMILSGGIAFTDSSFFGVDHVPKHADVLL